METLYKYIVLNENNNKVATNEFSVANIHVGNSENSSFTVLKVNVEKEKLSNILLLNFLFDTSEFLNWMELKKKSERIRNKIKKIIKKIKEMKIVGQCKIFFLYFPFCGFLYFLFKKRNKGSLPLHIFKRKEKYK